MNPMSKFAVFLLLAGVLTILFAFVPGDRPKLIPSEKVKTQFEKSEPKDVRLPRRAGTGGSETGKAHDGATKLENKIPSKVKIPAIRGASNYGWVELPRGTEVSLVRKTGDDLWVRWDGTVVKLPPVAAASGAVVVR